MQSPRDSTWASHSERSELQGRQMHCSAGFFCLRLSAFVDNCPLSLYILSIGGNFWFMKDSQVQDCIDYIKFTMELEGSQLDSHVEETARGILEGSLSADEEVSRYITDHGLGTNYEAGYDEMEKYPGTKCLVNYFNIKDKAELRQCEHFFVNIRTAQLFLMPMESEFTFSYLVFVHSHLFGDIYPSAGVLRTKDASKRKDFCRPQYIERYSQELFSRLSRDNYLRNIEDDADFANDLAFYMGEAEALHPFRDGNGRAVRFFFNRLVSRTGRKLHWAGCDADRMLEASIAAIDGDYQALVNVLEDMLVKRD